MMGDEAVIVREFCVLVLLGLNSWLDIKKRNITGTGCHVGDSGNDLDCV